MNFEFYQATENYATFDKFVSAPYLRHSFTLNRFSNATISVCTPGFYEIYINGKKITRGYLSPCISNPDEKLYYDVYDLNDYLVDGENVVGFILGNGNLNAIGGGVWNLDKVRYRSAPKLAVDFSATTQNGNITFDASVFVCTPSPIIFDDLRAGEWYDARNEISGWNLPGFDDKNWKKVIHSETPCGKLCENRVSPITVLREIKSINHRAGKIEIYQTLTVLHSKNP